MGETRRVASRYGQYCPLAIATELLGERWTMLVVMQLIEGVTRFNDLQRALPRLSPSTLTARLRTLEDAELVERKRARGGEVWYVATAAARELEPLLMELAFWGQRWGRDMEPDDLDPQFLAWSMHTRMDTDAMPAGRVVIEFEFTGVPERLCSRFWILKHEDDRLDVCISHPGHAVDLRVRSDLRRFVECWRGIRSLDADLSAGRIALEGTRTLCRAFPRWLLLSSVAHVERQRNGRERTAHRRTAARRG